MSRRALFGDIAGQILKCRDWEELKDTLHRVLTDEAPIRMPTSLKLQFSGDGTAIELTETDGSESSIVIRRGDDRRTLTLSSAGLLSSLDDAGTKLTSDPDYAEDSPSATVDVLGIGDKRKDRFVTATNNAGKVITISGIGGPGDFDSFSLGLGKSDIAFLPFRLTQNLTAGSGNHAHGLLLYWNGSALTDTAHEFEIYGDFMVENRSSNTKVFAVYGKASKRFWGVY